MRGWDVEIRLTQVSGGKTASYANDGDGNLVKAVDTTNNITTLIVGPHYEVRNGTVKKYYSAGIVRVAMRDGGALYWLLTDHLGSTNLTLDSSGNRVTELRYMPYGDMRYNAGGQKTTYRFTGQRWDQGHGLVLLRRPVVVRSLPAGTTPSARLMPTSRSGHHVPELRGRHRKDERSNG